MLQNWLRGSKYSKTRGPKGQNYAGPHFYGAPMASGAAVAVTLPPADQGDRETVKETLAKAGEEVAAEANRSGQPLEAVPVTAPGEARAQLRTPVETGGIQQARLRRHPNILKRLLVHLLPLDLGLVIRKVPGRGTPRGLQGSPGDLAVILWCLRKEAWALKLASITCPRRSDGLHAFPRLQCSLPRQLPKSLFLLPPDRRCNPAWVDVVWLRAMSPRQTDSSRVFSDSRHLKSPTPWPIWFCGQKSSSARFTEFRSDFYLFLQYSHSFSFGVTGKAKKDACHCRTPAENRRLGLPFRDRGLVDGSEYGAQELDPEFVTRAQEASPVQTRAGQRQRAKAVILSTACIALALSITDNASGSPQASRLFWTGTPAVSLSRTSLVLGNQSVGTPSTAQTRC